MLASYLLDEPLTSLATLNEMVPDLNDMFRKGMLLPVGRDQPLAVKTHFLPSVEVLRPYRDVSTKAIYIVRNPRDVIYSSKRFLHVADEHGEAYAMDFIANRGVQEWRNINWGTWPSHIREWTIEDNVRRHFPNIDVLIVRYEDMRADTSGTLADIIRFLEINAVLGIDAEPDPGRLERAVQRSSLDRMRATEKRDESNGTKAFRTHSKVSFFGEGLSGQSLAGFSDAVEEAYQRLMKEDEEFSGCARRFGYDF